MLHVFGDSHSMIWAGRAMTEGPGESRFPLVKQHYLKDALAYNLMGERNEAGKWGQIILAAIPAQSEPIDAVMLCFGEIDLRTQVIKRAAVLGVTLEAFVSVIVNRYVAFIDLLSKKTTAPIFVWGAVATASSFGDWNPEYPNVGSEAERNAATKCFNAQLLRLIKSRKNVFFFDIFDKLTTPLLQTRRNYFSDGCHIGVEALAMAIEAFNSIVREQGFDLPDFFDLAAQTTTKKSESKDISATARITGASSMIEGVHPQRIDIPLQGRGYIFHTNEDDNPHILVDLGYGALLRRLVIFNRFDAYKERAKTLEILVGNDLAALVTVYKHSGEIFGLDNLPLDIKIKDLAAVRYIVFRLAEKQPFHLGKINIWAESFL